MSTTGADYPSEPARLHRERQIQTDFREALALGRSLNPLPYLISVGVVATWTIGAFLGAGFFLLIHRPEALVSGLGVGSIDFRVFWAEGDRAGLSTGYVADPSARRDRLLAAPPTEPSHLSGDQLKVDRTLTVDTARLALGDLWTTSPAIGEMAPVVPAPNLPSAGPGQRSAPKSSSSASSREGHQRQPAPTRTPPAHAPVRAIKDLLHKHSRLAE